MTRRSLALAWCMLLVWCVLGVSASSASGHRVHVWTEADSIAAVKAEYSVLWRDLEYRQFDVSFHPVSASLQLIKYEERVCDHLIYFATSAKTLGGDMNTATVLDFLAKGGNLLIANSGSVGAALREIVHEFGVTFDVNANRVFDRFHALPNGVTTTSFLNNDAILPNRAKYGALQYTGGPAHTVRWKNPLIQSVVTAESTAVTGKTDDTAYDASKKSFATGKEISLVSTMQTRNNTRIAIISDRNMLSDAALSSTDKKANHAQFAADLLEWTFQERAVLRVTDRKHHKVGESTPAERYRIKDDIVYTLQLEEWNKDHWQPFNAPDLQLELIMLNPYVRMLLDPTPRSDGTHSAIVRLPDHYGVFTFQVDYRRVGYSYLLEKDVVPIVPFKHNEYPRFLSAAMPYYVSTWSVMLGTLAIIALWLFAVDRPGKATGKAKTK